MPTAARCRVLAGNNLSGTLPASWAATALFRRLGTFDASDNRLEGTIPSAWLNVSLDPYLYLRLDRNNLSGAIDMAALGAGHARL